MELKEIVNRSNNIPIQEEEAMYLTKEYVKVRKGVDVNPNLTDDLAVIHTKNGIELVNQITIMHHLVNCAIGWFRNNPNVL
jgi:hypothetical protein